MRKLLLFALPLIVPHLHAQTPIVEMPNAISICTESQACVITAVSAPAVFQFGAGSTWCQTFTAAKLPVPVQYATPANTALCQYDPAPNVNKTLAAKQSNTAYTVTYTLAGVKQPVKIIAALAVVVPPPVPTPTPAPAPAPKPPPIVPISQTPCLCTEFSDNHFECVATGPKTAVKQ